MKQSLFKLAMLSSLVLSVTSVHANELDIYGQVFISKENNNYIERLNVQPTQKAMIVDLSINNGDCVYTILDKSVSFPYLSKKHEDIKLIVKPVDDNEGKNICDVRNVIVYTMSGEYELNF